MVINPVRHGWSLRLENLGRLIEQDPDGPVWLWRMRVRILRYLISRYTEPPGVRPTGSSLDVPSVFDEAIEALPAMPPTTVLPMVAVPYPPRAAAAMMGLLHDVRTINEARRGDGLAERDPELIWAWWRETWCVRQSAE